MISTNTVYQVSPYVFENIYLPAAQGRAGEEANQRPISTYNKTGRPLVMLPNLLNCPNQTLIRTQ